VSAIFAAAAQGSPGPVSTIAVMSSRLVRERHGRLVVVVTVPRVVGETHGDTMLVLGDSFVDGGRRIGFLEVKTGRPPEPEERSQPTRAQVPDAPSGIRTRATALKGPRPGPLVDGGGKARIAAKNARLHSPQGR
jgi:hypothetical protein